MKLLLYVSFTTMVISSKPPGRTCGSNHKISYWEAMKLSKKEQKKAAAAPLSDAENAAIMARYLDIQLPKSGSDWRYENDRMPGGMVDGSWSTGRDTDAYACSGVAGSTDC